jgi:quinol monooxygenase YgiN
MIVGTLRILPPPNKRGEALEILRSVQGPVLAQPGCSACDIYDEQGSAEAVVFVERWETEEALEAHLCSDLYRRILAVVELSGSTPDIRFEHVSSREGIELIARLRGPGGPRSGS